MPASTRIPAGLRRTTPPALPELSQPEVLRHFLRLSQMTLGAHVVADTLGTCTMKYSPVVDELIGRTPAAHSSCTRNSTSRRSRGSSSSCTAARSCSAQISGFDAFCFQGGAGSPGHLHERARDPRLARVATASSTAGARSSRPRTRIPANAATAAVAGFNVISLMPGERGFPEIDALRAALSDRTAGLMITNPEDTGIFNPHIAEFVRLVHEAGGLCAYDQANGNPLLAVARARDTGFDLGQFNLHKTFGAPHNSTGPGAAAVGVRAELEPFLPSPVVVHDGGRISPAMRIGRSRSAAFAASPATSRSSRVPTPGC